MFYSYLKKGDTIEKISGGNPKELLDVIADKLKDGFDYLEPFEVQRLEPENPNYVRRTLYKNTKGEYTEDFEVDNSISISYEVIK